MNYLYGFTRLEFTLRIHRVFVTENFTEKACQECYNMRNPIYSEEVSLSLSNRNALAEKDDDEDEEEEDEEGLVPESAFLRIHTCSGTLERDIRSAGSFLRSFLIKSCESFEM